MEDYKFKDQTLLNLALTHSSAANKQKENGASNERLEFLGDSILNAILAETVYNKFKDYSEGELSIILANLVNAKTLTKIAIELDLAQQIVLDNGEERCGGRANPKTLENVLEAVIAAIYLDSNFDTVKDVVNQWWSKFFLEPKKLFQKDYKTKLQEYVQKKYKVLPSYKTNSVSGAAHNPTFTVCVALKGYPRITAQGRTKKEAEQEAAYKMLEYIKLQYE
ncbi:ribonuclease III [Candidatus Bandiella euplotis]|uniref:ribonuclease III n=1 Tax=Candidatus Bandiella euplotis TaxID=1664265 RepID=UPI002B25ECEE|nr:ribonuclease III [Candidatus Bandiella woodruffii]